MPFSFTHHGIRFEAQEEGKRRLEGAKPMIKVPLLHSAHIAYVEVYW